MRKIAIIGFGVLGQQVLNFLNESQQVQDLIIFDDVITSGPNISRVLPFNTFTHNDFNDYEFYIAIGYKHLKFRNEILRKLKELQRKIPSLIHHTCYISPQAKVSLGCIFFPMCNIDQNVLIEEGNIFHNNVIISHDCVIGSCNYFSPSVTFCGNIKFGKESFVGAGTTISNGLFIGDQVRIGIGTCVTKNIISNKSIIGNPQKELKSLLNFT